MFYNLIPQERLNEDAENFVCNNQPDRVFGITANLKDLKVIINYMSVMQYIHREKPLAEDIQALFGHAPAYLAPEIQLKHVRHVWVLVKFAQTDMLMSQHQV